jgi:hypothetical protein
VSLRRQIRLVCDGNTIDPERVILVLIGGEELSCVVQSDRRGRFHISIESGSIPGPRVLALLPPGEWPEGEIDISPTVGGAAYLEVGQMIVLSYTNRRGLPKSIEAGILADFILHSS